MKITHTYPTKLESLDEDQLNTGQFSIIDGELHKFCAYHNTMEPLVNFRPRKNLFTRYEKYCREGVRLRVHETNARRAGTNALNSHLIPEDVEGAKDLLTKAGYDINQDIHQQFMERYKRIHKEIFGY